MPLICGRKPGTTSISPRHTGKAGRLRPSGQGRPNASHVPKNLRTTFGESRASCARSERCKAKCRKEAGRSVSARTSVAPRKDDLPEIQISGRRQMNPAEKFRHHAFECRRMARLGACIDAQRAAPCQDDRGLTLRPPARQFSGPGA